MSEDGGIWDTRRLLSASGTQMRKAGGRGHRATPMLRVRGSRHMLETHLVAESTGHEVPGGGWRDKEDAQASSLDYGEEGDVTANRATPEKKWI